MSQEIGNGWAENIHPEDRQRCLDAYTKSFEQRGKYQSEYRLRRHDGEYRWILDTGVPRFNQDGSFAGYIGICVDVTDRKSAEQERDLMHERLRLAMKSGKAVGWDLDVATGRDLWFGDLQTQFGISSDTFSGRVEEFYRRLHPEDRARVAKAVQDAKRSHKPYAAEFRILWPDGTVRWIAADGKFEYAPDGEARRMSGISIDITDRKRTEDALRESEERLRLAAQIGKMYAAEWDVATDMVVQSPDFVKVLGEVGPERLTRPQLLETIHPEDREKFSAALANLTPDNPTGQVIYRLAPSERAVTWLEKSARAFFDEQGKMQRVISMVADVTDHKLAEEALSGLSRRLIEAQERERTRIARELHDDIAQRLAMLTIELQRLQHDLPDSANEVSSRLGEIRSQTLEISTDVQTLSHELHSSKLEYLGLVPAIRGFCKEFAEQNGLEIDFGSHDLPADLSADVSLGLFRVVQEALHNAAKHSMVRRAVVRLWGEPSGIHLTVSDLGEGFNVEVAMSGPGLGLTSMAERLHLLNGEILIESAPKQGTIIHAHVPLDQEDNSARQAS
jgi:PAS domain S-box-containing protein